ncbi:hypothetical protein F5050DRAFT_1847240 [Lentinula boryana]|uniref:Uncharacterized protein n=1 Tax=Lentinula boryana TaxID=40481 RepID=A0ABQ8Q4G4_9AGAR|nr:hypothetical protein F5050DRAFT_1847240 [Lentinula boryana]
MQPSVSISTESNITNKLWKYFRKGEKQNSTHYATYCIGCLDNAKESLRENFEERVRDADEATRFREEKKWFDDACQTISTVHGDKHAFIAHIIRSRANDECKYASAEAKLEAIAQCSTEHNATSTKAPRTTEMKWKLAQINFPSNKASDSTSTEPPPKKAKSQTLKTYNALNMPFRDDENHAVQAQALCAIVATNSPETLFKNPEMLKLFGMLRKESPAVIPAARVISGRLLDEAAEKANDKLKRVMKNRELGLVLDGWKSRKKDLLNGLCTNVDFKMQQQKTRMV